MTSRKRNLPSFRYSRGPPWFDVEHDLGQPVAGEVADRDAAAVVVVAVREDVELAPSPSSRFSNRTPVTSDGSFVNSSLRTAGASPAWVTSALSDEREQATTAFY